MLFLTAKVGFVFMTILSIMVSMASHSLLIFWVSLEVNMVAILPLFSAFSSVVSAEVVLKYFISQTVASIMYIFFSIFSVLGWGITKKLLLIAILFKIGLPPFQAWLTSVVMVSPLGLIFLVLVIQKFIPLNIMSHLDFESQVLEVIFFLTFTTISLSLKGLSSVRVLLLFSGWGNSLWMSVAALNTSIWVMFLSLYGVILLSVLMGFLSFNNQKISMLLNSSVSVKYLCLINLLNLAGLPPMSGFFMKLVVVKKIFGAVSFSALMGLMLISLLVLFTYISFSYYTMTSSFITSVEGGARLYKKNMFFMIFSASMFPLLSILAI